MATAAVTGALSGIGSALASQRRNMAPAGDRRPVIESSLPVLMAADKRQYSKLRRQAEAERLYNLLMQPEVLGLVITLTGIVVANNIPLSGDPGRNAALRSIATTASVLLGLGYAGIGDLTTLIIAASSGGVSLAGTDITDIVGPLPGVSDSAGKSILSTLLNVPFPGLRL